MSEICIVEDGMMAITVHEFDNDNLWLADEADTPTRDLAKTRYVDFKEWQGVMIAEHNGVTYVWQSHASRYNALRQLDVV